MALSFIIFGSKRREGDAGPAYPALCNNCGNYVYFHAYAYRTWGHVFWIPLVPMLKTRFLTCPVCMLSVELSKSEFKQAKQLAEHAQEFERGHMSEHEFKAEVRTFQEGCIMQADERLTPAVENLQSATRAQMEPGEQSDGAW